FDDPGKLVGCAEGACHELTYGVWGKELPAGRVTESELRERHAQHVAGPRLEREDDFSENLSEDINDIALVAADDIEIALLAGVPIGKVDGVGHRDGGGLHAIGEQGV